MALCASLLMISCADNQSNVPPFTPPDTPQGEKVDPIISGGNYDAGEEYGEESGEVVPPIQSGGNYEGGSGYGD